jgi:hypothetical protein
MFGQWQALVHGVMTMPAIEGDAPADPWERAQLPVWKVGLDHAFTFGYAMLFTESWRPVYTVIVKASS